MYVKEFTVVYVEWQGDISLCFLALQAKYISLFPHVYNRSVSNGCLSTITEGLTRKRKVYIKLESSLRLTSTKTKSFGLNLHIITCT